jgi:predicted nuclease with TOPRIM domain
MIAATLTGAVAAQNVPSWQWRSTPLRTPAGSAKLASASSRPSRPLAGSLMGQAEALAAAMTDTLATKQDLIVLRQELEVRFTQIDARFTRIDDRFASLEHRLDDRIAEQERRYEIRLDGLEKRMDSRMDAKLADLERRMTMRLGGITVTGIGVVSALVRIL